MRIRERVPKVRGSGVHRECSAEETYERVRPHFGRIGITEVVEVSGRLGIPVYQAVVPHAVDGVDGYWGKGLTPVDARTSAVMEAFERHAAWLPLRPTAIASHAELAAAGRAVVPPGDHNLRLADGYRDDRPVYWVGGHDLLHDEPVLVPHAAVAYGASPGAPPCYEVTTTNGLASGNSVEEAICHTLCEVLERDALTLAEVVGDGLGKVLADRGLGGQDRVDEWYPVLDPGTLPARVRPLAERFVAAGLRLEVRSITSDLGVPSILASVDAGDGHACTGLGTHPDVEVALTRAITECAQERAGEPQLPDPAGQPSTVDKPVDGSCVALSNLPSHPSDDIAADVRFLLDRLRTRGLPRVIAVDLSPPEIPVHVVRVLVPGLESWAIDHSKLGARAAAAWERAVAEIRG